MGFGALRSVARPVSRALLSHRNAWPFSSIASLATLSSLSPEVRWISGPKLPWIPPSSAFHSLTDTRYPKRRPVDKPKRKRPVPEPPGPYSGVPRRLPHDPKPQKNPNQGSVKRRNEKKRIKQRKAFILSEKKKRTALVQEAKRKKLMKRVERKMAAVARERVWVERLAELKKLEEEKKKEAAIA
ncbi:unnamed protein product [Cuscuta campestris]|uniref:Uncharacterized protein n=1 Tax=Cuscuta campestris TaxID=132261 RepID=A0A484MZ38_9ASTE|nr:unnamed protein product [Cuscuta campestris]